MEALKWKTITLATSSDDGDEQNIAKKLTSDAIAKKLCIIPHDSDENGTYITNDITVHGNYSRLL